MRTTRPVAHAAAAVTLALVLAACADATEGTTDESTGQAAGSPAATEEVESQGVEATHNAADMTFAQGMLPHHRQAVEMAELVPERTDNPEVLALAEEISAAQGPEIQTMTDFIETWSAEMDMGADMEGMEGMEGMDSDMEGMEGMDMEGMSGMMTPEDMAALEAAEGEAFDRMFLEMMVAHHEGAVEMAEIEVSEGMNEEALMLADEIISAQQSEIQRMQELLAAL